MSTESPPKIGSLLIPMTAWLVPSAILGLSVGDAPRWLGVALIVAGNVLPRRLQRHDGARRTAQQS
ncbi:MAG: hypothetical protein ACR2F6_04925 [Mycobacteriales bacterium]